MANWYVWNGGATPDGTTWAKAYTTLAAAMTAKPAGDTFFVAHDHVESVGSAITITSAGTDANPCKIYCVNRAGSVPPVSADLRTTATITTTGAFGITLAGTVSECYGIIFTCGTGATSANLGVNNTASRYWRLVNCALRLGTTATGSRINLAAVAGAGLVVLENTTMQFGNVSQQVQCAANVVWRNTPNAITGATIPTTLLHCNAAGGGYFLEGVDLSAVGAGKTLFNTAAGTPNKTIIKDCKLGGATITGTPTQIGGPETIVIRSDSVDATYRTDKFNAAGYVITSASSYRVGGASDGTTPISWWINTSAITRWEVPFECPPIIVWNDTIGSAITVTIEAASADTPTAPQSAIWIDVEYLGTAGFPLASKATSGKADGLAAGSATYPSSSETWVGGMMGKWSMSATITPQEKGPITIYVKAGIAAAVYFVDPKPVIT